MLKVGGYAMSFEDAAAWARRRYPGIDIYDDNLIPYIIKRHNNLLGGKIKTMAICKREQVLCLFVMHYEDDPKAVRGSFDRFNEDEGCILFKRKAFTNREDFEKAKFVTVLDPYDLGY